MSGQVTTVGPPAQAPPPSPSGGPLRLLLAAGGRRAQLAIVVPLLVIAAVAWTLTAGSVDDPMMSFGPFVAAWLVMMVAMMLPSVAPVVALYGMAARRGVVAAVPVFVLGYLAVWAVSALPAFAVASLVAEPLADGDLWVGRVTGAALLLAAGYQLTPLKQVCLRHCRSPLSFFLARTTSLASPRAAIAAGARHGAYCLGCCWALMAVLIAVGGMQLGWALALAAVIAVEKLLPWGALAVRATTIVAASLGLALIAYPSLLRHLVSVPMDLM